jgi:hypothetical protein
MHELMEILEILKFTVIFPSPKKEATLITGTAHSARQTDRVIDILHELLKVLGSHEWIIEIMVELMTAYGLSCKKFPLNRLLVTYSLLLSELDFRGPGTSYLNTGSVIVILTL